MTMLIHSALKKKLPLENDPVAGSAGDGNLQWGP